MYEASFIQLYNDDKRVPFFAFLCSKRFGRMEIYQKFGNWSSFFCCITTIEWSLENIFEDAHLLPGISFTKKDIFLL